MIWASHICFITTGKCALWRIFSIDGSVSFLFGMGLHKPRYLYVEGRVSEISLPEYDNSGLPSREKSACNTYQVNTKILFPNQNNIWVIKLNALPHINHGIISICYMAGILLPMRDKPEHSRFSSKTTEMFIPDHMVSRLVSGGISEHPC